MPITAITVPIDSDSIGYRWVIADEDELARLVGMVARCEFGHAEAIIQNLAMDAIIYDASQENEIKAAVIKTLTLKIDPSTGRELDTPQKYHRDGFLFEAISWIVARKHSPSDALLRDPHIGATTQGLDGLMIELNSAKNDITHTIVFEDKCTEKAQWTFAYKTLPAFKKHHKESRKILESATTLLRQEFRAGTLSSMAAKAVHPNVRKYRSGMTILTAEDTQTVRQGVFKNYKQLIGLNQDARIGCMLLTGTDVRGWFAAFAQKVIRSL